MNRRSFLRGFVATAILLQIPVSVVNAVAGPEATQYWAIAKLTKLWNEAAKSKPYHEIHFDVGKQFFEAFEGELLSCQRFCSFDAPPPTFRSLKFKSATVRCVGDGWGAKVV